MRIRYHREPSTSINEEVSHNVLPFVVQVFFSNFHALFYQRHPLHATWIKRKK